MQMENVKFWLFRGSLKMLPQILLPQIFTLRRHFVTGRRPSRRHPFDKLRAAPVTLSLRYPVTQLPQIFNCRVTPPSASSGRRFGKLRAMLVTSSPRHPFGKLRAAPITSSPRHSVTSSRRHPVT